MNTKGHKIRVGDLSVEIFRKAIKNLHLGVYPPRGRVRVAAPLAVSDEAVRLAVIGKLGWIRRQKGKFEVQPRQSAREMVNGESHFFLGRRYRLNLIEHQGAGRVILRNKSVMDLYVRPGSNVIKRRKVLLEWYREQLKARVPPLLEKWQPVLGVNPADWGIKQMKTKWGACTVEARRIWLNLELAKKSEKCLEYILVHELIHLLERHHNDRFMTLMDQFMPFWRHYREELNQTPLRQEKWDY
jgi:predicted metal-dependent hydrolase